MKARSLLSLPTAGRSEYPKPRFIVAAPLAKLDGIILNQVGIADKPFATGTGRLKGLEA